MLRFAVQNATKRIQQDTRGIFAACTGTQVLIRRQHRIPESQTSFVPAAYPPHPGDVPPPFVPEPAEGERQQGQRPENRDKSKFNWVILLITLGFVGSDFLDGLDQGMEMARRWLDGFAKPSGPETAHINTPELRTFSTECEDRRINVCIFNDTPAARAKGPAVVLNTGTIASARPLALALAKSVDCVVVCYTHAGLVCDNDEYYALKHLGDAAIDKQMEAETRRWVQHLGKCTAPRALTAHLRDSNCKRFDDLTEILAKWRRMLHVAAHVSMDTVSGGLILSAISGEDGPLYSRWFSPPLPVSAPPTSDFESKELVSVLRAADIADAVLVSTHYNWLATTKTALRNPDACAGLVLIDPLVPHIEPLRTVVDWHSDNNNNTDSAASTGTSKTVAGQEGKKPVLPLYGATLGMAPLLPLQEGFSPALCKIFEAPIATADRTPPTNMQELVQYAMDDVRAQGTRALLKTMTVPVYGQNIMDAVYAHQCLIGSGLDPIGTIPATELFSKVVPAQEKAPEGQEWPGNFKSMSFGLRDACITRSPFFQAARLCQGVPDTVFQSLSRAAGGNGEKTEDARTAFASLKPSQAPLGFHYHRNNAIQQKLMVSFFDRLRQVPVQSASAPDSKSASVGSDGKSDEKRSEGVRIPKDATHLTDVFHLFQSTRIVMDEKGANVVRLSASDPAQLPLPGAEAFENLANIFTADSGKLYTPLNYDSRLQWIHQHMEGLRLENYLDALIVQCDHLLNLDKLQKLVDEIRNNAATDKKSSTFVMPPKMMTSLASSINATIAVFGSKSPLNGTDLAAQLITIPDERQSLTMEGFLAHIPPAMAILLAQANVQRRDFVDVGIALPSETGPAAIGAVFDDKLGAGSWMTPIIRLAFCRALAARLTGKHPLTYNDAALEKDTTALLLACRHVALGKDSKAPEPTKDLNVVRQFASRSNVYPGLEGPPLRLVYCMEDALAALSTRAQTLEPYRLQLEPHRWAVGPLFAWRYAATVDSRINPSNAGNLVALTGSDPVMKRAVELVGGDGPAADVLSNLNVSSKGTETLLCSGLLSFMKANLGGYAEDATAPTNVRRKAPFPTSVVITEIPDSRLAEASFKEPVLHQDIDLTWKPFSATPVVAAFLPGRVECSVAGPPNSALITLRTQLQQHQRRLHKIWSLAVPGAVTAIAPETGADVNATLHQASALLKESRNFALVGSLRLDRLPVVRYDLQLTGNIGKPNDTTKTVLQALHIPIVSGRLKDTLTILSDVASYGGPQPYRAPVATLASHIGQMVHARTVSAKT